MLANHFAYRFFVGAAKWQVKFMKKQDEQVKVSGLSNLIIHVHTTHTCVQVKVLIQRAKAWRNRQWPRAYPGQKKPKSYFLSLLVVKAYEQVKKKYGELYFRDMAEKYVSYI